MRLLHRPHPLQNHPLAPRPASDRRPPFNIQNPNPSPRRRTLLPLLRHRLVLRRRKRSLQHGDALLRPGCVAHPPLATQQQSSPPPAPGSPLGIGSLRPPHDTPRRPGTAVDLPEVPKNLKTLLPGNPLLPPRPLSLRHSSHPCSRQSSGEPDGRQLHRLRQARPIPKGTTLPTTLARARRQTLGRLDPHRHPRHRKPRRQLSLLPLLPVRLHVLPLPDGVSRASWRNGDGGGAPTCSS